ncbi:MAG: hypothetical protein ABFS56_21260 [Pseudomonadota bacterium]
MTKQYKEEIPKHYPQNRKRSESKLRKSRKNCPVCLKPLGKNSKRTRLSRKCDICGAQRIETAVCGKCGKCEIWISRAGAACQLCGNHGQKREVYKPQ